MEEMAQETNEALVASRLTKLFDGKAAVDNLNLRVQKGSVFGLLGPNSAGKTTTMKLIMNLLHPTAGSIRVLGRDAVRDAVTVKQRVGYLPETPKFYTGMRVADIIRFSRALHPRWDDAGVERWRKMFDLAEEARIFPAARPTIPRPWPEAWPWPC